MNYTIEQLRDPEDFNYEIHKFFHEEMPKINEMF